MIESWAFELLPQMSTPDLKRVVYVKTVVLACRRIITKKTLYSTSSPPLHEPAGRDIRRAGGGHSAVGQLLEPDAAESTSDSTSETDIVSCAGLLS